MRVCGVSMSVEIEEVVRHTDEGETVLVKTSDGRRFMAVPLPDDEQEDIFDEPIEERVAAAEADIAAGRCHVATVDEIMRTISADE